MTRLLAPLLLFSLSVSAIAAEQPNVVLIMADDIGMECYGCYGSEFYETPHIDELAASGARLTHAYAQPICTPSRVRIMTGRYNFRNYTRFGELDLSQPTFARMVRQNGYRTAIAGKWQLSDCNLQGPHTAGFDEYLLWHFGGGKKGREQRPPKFKSRGPRYKSPRLFRNGVEQPADKNGYGPDCVTNFACDFIQRHQDKPFVLYYPMLLVHSPYDPTPNSVDWDGKDPARSQRDHFREMVGHMDHVVGRIVQTLEETGLRDNTLIMVTGDNGTGRQIVSPFPGRGTIRGGKGSMTDAGTHVAFVASWPDRIQAGSVVDSPVDFGDVLPTIAEVTGSQIPEGTDGESLLPLLLGDDSQARGWVFMSYSRGGLKDAPYRCFARNRDWKLYSDGSMYHVSQDHDEQSPVDPNIHPVEYEELQSVLDQVLNDVPAEHIRR